MNIQNIPIDRVNPAPYNPRLDLQPDDPRFKSLARSVEEFGLVEPLVWNSRTGNLVGGHQRFKVLKARRETSVPAVVVDLPPTKEKALNLALNKVQGDWDEQKLAELLSELVNTPEFDLELTGFEFDEARDLIDEFLDNQDAGESFDVDKALKDSGPAVTQPGDLILLGQDPALQHRLLCGDATNPEHVKQLMDGQRAVLFATDPPYLVDYEGEAWDDSKANPDLYEKFIGVAVEEAVAPHAAWYCWHASRRQAMLEAAWTKHGAFVHCQVIWAKNRPVLGRSWYLWQHEPCLMGWVRGNMPPRANEYHLSTVWDADTLPHGDDRPDHPTPKPVELFEIPMRQHTRRGEICYEPFAGSGTQIIAAQRLGRRCFALELSPVYCDLIVRRFIAAFGEGAVIPEIARKYRPVQKEVRA